MGRKCCSTTSTVIPFSVTNFVGVMSAAMPMENPHSENQTVAMARIIGSPTRADCVVERGILWLSLMRGCSRGVGWLVRNRNERPDRAIVVDQVLTRDALHILGGDGSDSLKKLVDFTPAGTDRFGPTQQHGVEEVRILFKSPSGFNLILGPLEFLIRRRLRLQSFDFLVERLFNRFNLLSRTDEGIEVEEARIGLHQAILGADCDRGFLFVDEALVQPRALAPLQDRFENIEGIRVLARKIWHAITHHHERDLCLPL